MKGAILVVEDEQAIADLVRAYLGATGSAWSGPAAASRPPEELSRHPVRLVVLDLGLPGMDGFEVCRRLRARTGVPILILSARDDEADRVAGLKRAPTIRHQAVLAARAGRPGQGDPAPRLGRARRRGTAPLVLGDVELDPAARAVIVGGEPVELTSREFDLLAALLAHPGVVLSRDRLLDLVWQGESRAGRGRWTSTSRSCARSSTPGADRDRARVRLQGRPLMRSLRARLFAAILGAVLLAVGASLALGIVLTKDAVRGTIRGDVERQANALATQLGRLPAASAGSTPRRRPGGRRELPRRGRAASRRGPSRPAVSARRGAGPRRPILAPIEAASCPPPRAELRHGGAANGTAEIEGASRSSPPARAVTRWSSSPAPTWCLAMTSAATSRPC